MEEKNAIFRKKSIDRLSSPEQLDDYITVISPRVWVFISAVIIFLVGILCFGFFGNFESSVRGVAIVSKGEIKMYVSSDRISEVDGNMSIVINKKQYAIRTIIDKPQKACDAIDTYSMDMAGYEDNTWVYEIDADLPDTTELRDAAYQAYIVVEKINPYKFVLN